MGVKILQHSLIYITENYGLGRKGSNISVCMVHTVQMPSGWFSKEEAVIMSQGLRPWESIHTHLADCEFLERTADERWYGLPCPRAVLCGLGCSCLG